MASFTEHIRIVIDSVSDITGIKTFRTEVAAADGALGKVKAGAGSIFSTISQNAGLAAVVVGGALVKAGLDAVDKFDAMALAARNLSTATGLSVEQASRWIGVAKDMGVNQDLLFHGMSQIAKHIESDVWGKYGIQVHDAQGKLKPTNDILLEAAGLFDSLSNETEKAAAGEALFRRGYRTLSPLFDQGKEALKGYLATVESGQVITGHELAQAEENIRAQKNLKQAFGNLSLTLGELFVSAAPVLRVVTDLVNPLVGLAGAAVKTFTGVHGATTAFEDFFSILKNNHNSTTQVADELQRMIDSGNKANGFLTNFGRAWGQIDENNADIQAQNLHDFNNALKDLAENSPAAAAQVVQSLKNMMKAAQEGDPAAAKIIEQLGLTDQKLSDISGKYADVAQAQNQTDLETRRLTGATLDAADALDLNKKALDAHKKAQDEVNKVVQEATKRESDYLKSLDDTRQAQLDSIDTLGNFDQSVRDVDDAFAKLKTSQEEDIKTQQDGKKTTDEKAQSTRDLASSTYDLLGKINDAGKAYATSRGDIEGSNAATQDRISFLLIEKAKYPELAGEIDRYIAKLQSIPPKIDTAVQLHLNAHVDNIIIDGETHAAGQTSISVGASGLIKRSATGIGPGFPGGFTTLNEQGREAIFLPQGSQVLGASQTASATPQPSYVDHSTHIYNLPPGLSPQAVAQATRNYARRGGR